MIRQFALPVVAVVMAAAGSASATVVNELGGGSPWDKTDMRGAGTADIVSLSGQGGNLENNAPLPTGAVKLTTGVDNNDKAEIGIQGNFGLVSEIFSSGLSFSYSLFKEFVASGNQAAAPSLKLGFYNADYDAANDGFVQLIFEPYYNQPGNEGSSSNPPTGVWEDYAVSFSDGLLWNSGGFGQANSFGGPPFDTLEGWQDAFDSTSNGAFSNANLTYIGLGIGTYNLDTVGYLDNVAINGTLLDDLYDFEAASEVPSPATGLLLLTGLATLVGLRRRRAA